MRILGIIPARFASSRFPGKPLALLAGLTMIEHVYRQACQARSLNNVLVATDDHRIEAEVRRFGGDVRITRCDHATGTDRLAEVAATEFADCYINIQGDEPLIDPQAIDACASSLRKHPDLSMATLKKRIIDETELLSPNVVKVVTALNGDAIYFSRTAIPYERSGDGKTAYWKHIGLYAYRRDLLLAYPGLPVGPLETAERLEQLRALENGYRIRVIETSYQSIGVDVPEDLERVEGLLTQTEQ